MSLLLTSKYTHHAFLELTSRCNLRCVYCAVSQPSYQSEDFDLSRFDALISDLKERGIHSLNLNGHGETTMIKDWHRLCNRLLSEDIKLVIITNLSRRLTDEEVETLSQFHAITASCDTVDSEFFTKMRRSAKLEIFYENIERIQAASRKINHEPVWGWSAVVTDMSVFGMKDLAREGLKRNIRDFSLVGLTKYDPLPEGSLRVKPIDELLPEQFAKAQQCLTEVEELIIKGGGQVAIQAGLRSALLKEEKGETQASKSNPAKVEKKTKDCLFPWTELFFKANGDVAPCCWAPPVGKISEGTTLKSILKNGKLKKLRASIISGDLPPTCQTCPSAKWTSVKKMRWKLMSHRFFFSMRASGESPFRIKEKEKKGPAPR